MNGLIGSFNEGRGWFSRYSYTWVCKVSPAAVVADLVCRRTWLCDKATLGNTQGLESLSGESSAETIDKMHPKLFISTRRFSAASTAVASTFIVEAQNSLEADTSG